MLQHSREQRGVRPQSYHGAGRAPPHAARSH
jgi:hypothetical protein